MGLGQRLSIIRIPRVKKYNLLLTIQVRQPGQRLNVGMGRLVLVKVVEEHVPIMVG